MGLPQPITNTDTFLVEVIKQLEAVNTALATLEKLVTELQRLNDVATQKPSIQLDATKVAESVTPHMVAAFKAGIKQGKSTT